MSAKPITPEQLDAVCAELERGCSYCTASKRVGVSVAALRWHRCGDPAIGRHGCGTRDRLDASPRQVAAREGYKA